MASSFAPLQNKGLLGHIANVMSCLDDRAYYNVVHSSNGYILDKNSRPVADRPPGGGPFSAVMGISSGEDLVLLSESCVNEVLLTGIPTQHAEDRAMRPEIYEKAITILSDFKKAKKEVVVWGFSSAEPCPTCLTKFVIMASDLTKRGLIKAGNFAVVYGASYEDTLKIAGFNDQLYAKNLKNFSIYPHSQNHPLKVIQIERPRVPDAVWKLFIKAKKPMACIARDGRIVAIGEDMRSPYDPFSTPEVVAINNACLNLRAKGIQEPWKADLGEMYTTSPIGPLGYASAQWTSIKYINKVVLPINQSGSPHIASEVEGRQNTDLLKIVARGKNNGVVRLVHYSKYPNESQLLWRDVIAVHPQAIYNGSTQVRYQQTRPRTSPEEQYFGTSGTRRYPEFIR